MTTQDRMHHQTPEGPADPRLPSLADRYVHAATRRLPEDQRADVAEELRTSIADRVEALRESRPELDRHQAERAALEELGDPDRLAAGYAGRRLGLISPEIYPAYVRALKAILVVVVPLATLISATIEALVGGSVGSVVGGAAWMAWTLSVHIVFWVTVAFVLVERHSAPEDVTKNLSAEWTPDALPDVPERHGAISDLVASLAMLAILATLVVWQQLRPPVPAGEDQVPVLDPGLWSFWLPLILVLMAAEAVFEVVKFRRGRWTPRLAGVNVVTGALFAAPLVYLAASDRLLNPAAVAGITQQWAEFDPDVVNTVVVVAAIVIWVWDSIDGWRRALS